MIEIHVADLFEPSVNPAPLERAAIITLETAGAANDVDMTIVIADDRELTALNKQFRGISGPTDVLSFSANEIDPETGREYLGDIVISYERASEQAVAAGHPKENELQLLVVHGVLHLLGYDHDLPEKKEQMWSIQSNILKSLGCTINKLPEE